MKKYFFQIVFALAFFSSSVIIAQQIPVNENHLAKIYPYTKPSLNKVINSDRLNSFYQKLFLLKKNGQGVISIVHIGDSHIQPDFMTSLIRDDLQNFFGNAGRGIIFPYQLAKSNAPADVGSSSNTIWEFNRLAHPEIPIASGISGFCIQTNNREASFNIYLKHVDDNILQSFNRVKVFFDNSSSASWLMKANNNDSAYLIKEDSSFYKEIFLKHYADSLSFSCLPSDELKKFYGVSVENSNPGIIYHCIGVNGARYESFNVTPLFWQQLPALKADLYIISLGTNEAQKTDLDQKIFLQQVNQFLEKIKSISPDAAILITTPADDFYKRRRPNIFLKKICNSLTSYCNHNQIPLWDMYHITGSYGSAYKWLKKGLMEKDRVHFTNDGYRIQGNLLFNALAKGYNNYFNENNFH